MGKTKKDNPSLAESGDKGNGTKSEADFQKDFGDFHAVRAVRSRCSPSPNGHYVGLWFELATGESLRVSVPVIHAHEFGGEFGLALARASEHLAQNYDDPAGIA
jgi:hypothetical protein